MGDAIEVLTQMVMALLVVVFAAGGIALLALGLVARESRIAAFGMLCLVAAFGLFREVTNE